MQFSLKWLLVAIAFIAVSLVALLNANEWWRSGFRTAVQFSVLVAVIGAVWSVGTTRAFCGGYAIVTLCWFTRFFGAQWADLVTTDALSAIHSQAFAFNEEKVENYGSHIHMSYDGDIVGVPAVNSDNSATILVVRPRRQYFTEVGHAAFSVAFGVVGGFIAVAFYRRRPTPIAA